jgi:hypothetical protein
MFIYGGFLPLGDREKAERMGQRNLFFETKWLEVAIF